jgi:hypothetical protein
MSDTNKLAAQEAIFEEIARQAKSIENDLLPREMAPAIRDLAVAYRHAAGGPQSGGV